MMAIGTGIPTIKQCNYKAWYHVTALFSDSNPGSPNCNCEPMQITLGLVASSPRPTHSRGCLPHCSSGASWLATALGLQGVLTPTTKLQLPQEATTITMGSPSHLKKLQLPQHQLPLLLCPLRPLPSCFPLPQLNFTPCLLVPTADKV